MRIALWIEASRPKTLIASISPVLIGTAIAYHHGAFQPLIFLLTLMTAMFLQIGTNLANDYFDAKKGSDSPSRIGPRRITQAGLVSDTTMKRAILITFLIASSSCLYLIAMGGAIVSYLLLLAIFLGIGYTAGPFALAYRGLGDLFVFIFFGPVAVFMTTYLHTNTFFLDAFFAGIAPGALSSSILTINNLRDFPTDAASHKKTLVVRYGESFGRWECATLFALAFTLPIFMHTFFDYNVLILTPLVLILFSILLLQSLFLAKSPYDYLPLLPKTALLLALYSLLFSLGAL